MASMAGLSASVTRILSLTGFPKELKTKDIQSAFAEWESVNGGYKIKWKDDTSLLIVFQDALTAKRAYLQTLAFPPAIFASADGAQAQIRPYDGPDAQNIIQTVNTRHNSNPSRSHNNRANSISVFPNGGGSLGRSSSFSSATAPSMSASNSFRNGGGSQHPPIPEFPNPQDPQQQPFREQPSPTLPNLPSHPTLNSLISSSLGDAVANPNGQVPQDPAILATSLSHNGTPPRIGDPGKRMLGHALGVRHPGLSPRQVNGGGSPPDQGMRDVQRGMSGLVVAE